jgi:hypothetical protein
MKVRSPPTPSEAFTARFLGRMPAELAASFTPDQLAAVQRAFGMRYAMDHALDVRRSVILPWGRFYLVLLGGRDRRNEGGRGAAPCGWLVLYGAAASALLALCLYMA